MQHEFSGTLAKMQGSPLRKFGKMSVTTKQIADRLLPVKKDDTFLQPDNEAIRFYALNQLMGILALKYTESEKLPDWAEEIATDYEAELLKQHQYLLWYIFLITTREFRHQTSWSSFYSKHKDTYGPEFENFCKSVSDSSSQSSCNAWLKVIPSMEFAHYTRLIEYAFDHGSYSGGFGGKAWGNVARCLADYTNGDTNAEMFVDTAYTLAHNNGPIFNKQMFYQNYTGNLIKLLDIQRGGMMCEGVISGEIKSILGSLYSVDQKLTTQILRVKEEVKDSIKDKLDWHHIEKMGAVSNIQEEKAKAPPKPVAPPKPKVFKLDGKTYPVTGEFMVMPAIVKYTGEKTKDAEVVQIYARTEVK